MRLRFNAAGFEELLTSAHAKSLIEERAEAVAERANAIASTTDPTATEPYYEVQDGTTDRARFRVRTALGEQFRRNVKHEAKTNALEQSL